jgi:hypothetical protein
MVDVPVAVATIACVMMTVALTWASWSARDSMEERVIGAVTKQNELTSIVANLTKEVDDLMLDVSAFQRRQTALRSRKEALAGKSGTAEVEKLNELKTKTVSDLKRIKDFIEASKKELLDFINKKS